MGKMYECEEYISDFSTKQLCTSEKSWQHLRPSLWLVLKASLDFWMDKKTQLHNALQKLW